MVVIDQVHIKARCMYLIQILQFKSIMASKIALRFRRRILTAKYSNIPSAKTGINPCLKKPFHCLATISTARSGFNPRSCSWNLLRLRKRLHMLRFEEQFWHQNITIFLNQNCPSHLAFEAFSLSHYDFNCKIWV